jgi:glyoxylase-like metal-dependent hydrolase (beta-lactamase superfamily II)
MTLWGTNSYIAGNKDVVIIDPGPVHEAHLRALISGIDACQTVHAVIVTHSHKDHSPLARPLADHLGVPVLAYGASSAGRSEVMNKLANSGFVGGGEGVDLDFEPDITVQDAQVLRFGTLSLDVIHTPGHMGNHICLAYGEDCFTADHVMGWATSLVSPPDGDLTDFMESCEKLSNRQWRSFFPGHGHPILQPNQRLSDLIAHRKSREQQILDQLAKAAGTVTQLTQKIYQDVPRNLWPAAERNVLAHLIDLRQRQLVTTSQDIDPKQVFRLSEKK